MTDPRETEQAVQLLAKTWDDTWRTLDWFAGGLAETAQCVVDLCIPLPATPPVSTPTPRQAQPRPLPTRLR